ncbi:TatD family hydrolase [Amycolatopsis cihanbeyliensis]|uniref:TatD DNase family protein n=1 Tax=Amycolatopsis cihanbeyliensis TaxID=1128664 RepID=A0A542DPK7_AMYCI|nr:TatD family hydrolase [Amycolatopsis cihanbeyliensis]TQJ05041.1 TatD DNase family protein [Amycolatopsis cihanbeyliensis]
MRRLPSIDMHAHIEPDISPGDLLELGALVFAATRSLDEAEQALKRSDSWTVWGVGCHPGLVGVQKAFDADQFADLVTSTSYVSEVGLDGKSRVPMHRQQETLDAVLATLEATPRITSIHSYAATGAVLECLAARPICGAVLHWWLGDQKQTDRAVELGCFFSVNASMLRRPDLLASLPLDRAFPETDHPFGDKSGGQGRRPGNVEDVERALAQVHGLDQQRVRQHTWRNLAELVRTTKCGALLPRSVRVALAASV